MKISIKKQSDNGDTRIFGDAVFSNVKFVFNLWSTGPQRRARGGHTHVLDVRVISPTTNRILQKEGKERKKLQDKIEKKLASIENNSELTESQKTKARENYEGKLRRIAAGLPLEELNVHASRYLSNPTDADIRREVESLVKKLYNNNQATITKAFGQSTMRTELSARLAYDLHSNSFFCTLAAVTAPQQKERENVLRSFCDELVGPINDLTPANIANAVERLSAAQRRRYLRMIEKFFEYCGEARVYQGVNPITRYRDQFCSH